LVFDAPGAKACKYIIKPAKRGFMKKYVTEFIGTFFLVLTVVQAVNNGASALAALPIGLILVALVYAGGPISGGHFNPAVTVAMRMRGALDRIDFPYYILAQLLGSALAALIGVFLLGCGRPLDINLQDNDNALCSVLAEFLGTFVLTFVYLNGTAPRAGEANSFYGLAAGFALAAMIITLGGISGGAFNPAVALGAAISGNFAWSEGWIYLLGNLLGAAAAATVYQIGANKK
jgi:aquaporin Z